MEDPQSMLIAVIILVILTGLAGFGKEQESGSRKPNWYVVAFGVAAGAIALAVQFKSAS